MNEFQSNLNKEKTIDFDSLSRERLVDAITTLIIENKRLQNLLIKEQNDRSKVRDAFSGKDSEQKLLIEKIETFARKFSPTYLSMKENGEKPTPPIVIDTVEKDILNLKKSHTITIIKNQEEILKAAKLVDELTNQQIQMAKSKNMNQLEEEIHEDVISDSEAEVQREVEEIMKQVREQANETSEQEKKDETPITEENFEMIAKKMVAPMETNIALNVVNFDDIKRRCKQGERDYIRIVGEQGYSLVSEIERTMEDIGYTKNQFEQIHMNLKGMSMLSVLEDTQKVKTMARRGGVRVAWLSKDVGEVVFNDIFKKKAVKPEQQILREENDNLQHGYSIKEVAGILKEQGYTNISYDRRKNTISLEGKKKSWIPDIIATNSLEKLDIYFEVEFGNHSKDDFEEKLDKANMKASVLKIITASLPIKKKLQSKIEYYLNKKESYSCTIYVLTYEEFKDKKKGVEFNFAKMKKQRGEK